MAMDFPATVDRCLMLLDIALTLTMYDATDRFFATANFHWFMLIQLSPLLETMLASGIDAYLDRRCAKRPSRRTRCKLIARHDSRDVQGLSRGGEIDLEHERADIERGQRSHVRYMCCGGEDGVIGQYFDALAEWRKVVRDKSRAM